MKWVKYILIGAAAATLAGCSSTGADNGGNTSVNKPYVPDVGSSASQNPAGQNSVTVYTPTNTVAEPSGAGAPAGNR